MRETQYPKDREQLEALGAARQDFESWMDELDKQHRRLGSPYGQQDVWDCTGPACWITYFREGVTPTDALLEDLSYAD